jgi:hypothetical protein
MADTFTTSLKIRQPATGAYNNTWGAVLNANVFQLFDTSIAGLSPISIGSAVSYSMPAMANGTDTPSRYFCIQFTGTPPSPVTVTLPSSVSSKFYLVDNLATGQPLTFTYAGSTNTVTVPVGAKHLIWCDGSNVWEVSAAPSSSLNGYGSSNFARVLQSATEISTPTPVQNIFIQGASTVTNVYPWATITLPVGSTITLNAQFGDSQQVTLTGNYTMGVPSNAIDGSSIDLIVIQDGTGGRLLTWNAIFLFEGAATPTLSTVAGGIDQFKMIYNAGLNKWLVEVISNITTPAGASMPLTIATNQQNWRLLPLLGTLGGPVTVTITVNQGVFVTSASPVAPAMDLSGLPSGSTVNLINNGYIIGCGGDGGQGGMCNQNGDNDYAYFGTPGGAGGNAILGPGLSRTFTVNNTNGFIWGGGGGGGGGGMKSNDSSSPCNGGGGGGGAGFGKGGPGGFMYTDDFGGNVGVLGSPGTPGFWTQTGAAANGLGGAGTTASLGTAAGGAGGPGGTFGAAGSAGVVPVSGTNTTAAGLGGPAGKAIELQGAGAPTVGGSVLGLIS